MSARRETFEAGGLKITTWKDLGGRSFVCWKPHVSIFCQTSKEVLQFAAWPASLPTGARLREWLGALDTARETNVVTDETPTNPEQSGDLLKATGFGPEHHDNDPTANTRTII